MLEVVSQSPLYQHFREIRILLSLTYSDRDFGKLVINTESVFVLTVPTDGVSIRINAQCSSSDIYRVPTV